MNRAILYLIIIFLFAFLELIFIFKNSRSEEKHNDDNQNTPDIIENKYGNYCEECGATIDDNHKYCTNCGKGVR